MREIFKSVVVCHTQRIEPPSMENAKRLIQDLTIASLAVLVYLAARQLDLPETPTIEASRNISIFGSTLVMDVAVIAAGIRTIRIYPLFHQDRVSGAFERRSQLPPTLSP